jgi:hypothetical protein
MSGQIPAEIARGRRLPSFIGLAGLPPAIAWFANIANSHKCRAHENAVGDFKQFAGRAEDDLTAPTRLMRRGQAMPAIHPRPSAIIHLRNVSVETFRPWTSASFSAASEGPKSG